MIASVKCVLDTAFGYKKYDRISHDGAVSNTVYTSCGRLLVSTGGDNKGKMLPESLNLTSFQFPVSVWCSKDMHRVFSFDTDDRVCSVSTHPIHPHLLAYTTRGNKGY